jgi:hypothetical protein
MRKTLIALIAATPLVAAGAYAFAAQPASTGDDLFAATPAAELSAAEKAEPLKAVVGKTIRLGDDMDSERGEHDDDGEHGEMGEGMDD